MTINQLWGKMIPGVKFKSPVNFSAASSQVVAIDFNCYLHGSCSKPFNTLLMTNDPVCPPNDIIKTIESWNDGMIKNNIVLFYLVDGAKHCMKSTTHENRSNNRKKAKIVLHSFHERVKDASVDMSDEEHNQAMRNIKSMATPK